MHNYDKHMALDVIGEALTAMGAPQNRLDCGLLSHAERQAILKRIPES